MTSIDVPAPGFSGQTDASFSRRSAWDLRPNAIGAQLEERQRAGSPPRYDLTSSSPTRCGLGWSATALRSALEVPGLERDDPEPQGLAVAREAIAAYLSSRGHAARADALFLTASTSEAYAWLFKLLADPGERVLVPRPSYPLFEYLAGLEGLALESYPLRFDGRWCVDLGALREQLAKPGPPARALIAVNPGNPTGAFLARTEAAELAELCASHGLALISDEVFSDYAHDPGPAPAERMNSLLGPQPGLVFCLNGLSKLLALPQLKLGWIHVGGPAAQVREACRRLELIADTWLPVASPVQRAAPRLLAHALPVQSRILARVRENLALLRTQLAPAPALSVLPVEAGWNAVLRVPSLRSDEEWALALLERDVSLQPGYFFDFERPGYLVASLLPEPALFAEAAQRIREVLG